MKAETAVLAPDIQVDGARPHLETVQLTKRFGPHVAVDRIDLALKPGEFVTLLGPSGSGKSTTLNMIGGFEPPTSGDVFIDGLLCTPLPPNKRNLGVVFQDYALFPHMTVAANIAYPLRLRGITKSAARARVQEMLDVVRLPSFGDRYPIQLSGGQQQRVALARALVFRPQALLMDEPLGSLDKKLRDEMELEIRRIHRELGVTVLYVTHDQEEALTMSDRIGVMHEGRLAQIASPTEIYERPTTRFVANFIGKSNFLDGRVVRTSDDELSFRDRHGNLFVVKNPPTDCLEDARVTLSVRPERAFFLDSTGRSESGLNVVKGQVQEVVYVGERVRYHTRLASGEPFVVTVSNRLGAVMPHHGEAVEIGWSTSDGVVILDDEEDIS